jgi:hypothetical protein
MRILDQLAKAPAPGLRALNGRLVAEVWVISDDAVLAGLCASTVRQGKGDFRHSR